MKFIEQRYFGKPANGVIFNGCILTFGLAFFFACTPLFFCLTGCANITAPTGGPRDTIPPKLILITPKDSLLNTKVKKIEMHFDEYVTVNDVSSEIQISPILSIVPTVVGVNKKVTTKIIDTLLEDSTTYRISYGKAIKDVHEGNPFKNYTYTFSTCGYFDSMQLSGSIIDAATGMPDTVGVVVELFRASVNDSEVVRHKPKYVTRVDNKGNFKFKGLPHRSFRIYAIKESNGNLVYDGIGEKIAFNDSIVTCGDTLAQTILLRLFAENIDTSSKKKDSTIAMKKTDSIIVVVKKGTDTANSEKNEKKITDTISVKEMDNEKGKSKSKTKDEGLSYAVNIDTSNKSHRTFDIIKRVNFEKADRWVDLKFNRRPDINNDRISLFYAEDTLLKPVSYTLAQDTVHAEIWHLTTKWMENTVYTLKLAKSFAKDSLGNDANPSKYVFKTLENEDYGKVRINLPTKYYDRDYLLMINADNDTVYRKAVIDTVVVLDYLKPAKYTLRIIVDENHNGKWDTGDLFLKRQPELVIPYRELVNLKAGWEEVIDFEQKRK